ncbi:MAG: NADH:ubiquinone reductase (Na(+)-transporting) subunit A [Gemmobacter sp.]|nr:NADH:ubiquinone reductase (Na(+)-transporting) subunit A [Gemmobacter sp.]
MKIRFGKGRDPAFGVTSDKIVANACVVSSVGLLARDFAGTVLDVKVAEGQQVRRGQVLCADGHDPQIVFVAPVAGRVSRIHRGARRRVEQVVVTTEDDTDSPFDPGNADRNGVALRSLLLASGAWVAFRTRPYGRIPTASARPSAIFVTATDSNPLALDPALVLAPQIDAFRRGAKALLHLTEGPVFVCQNAGEALIEPEDRLRSATFSGPHPSGLAGTHIHRLWPVSQSRTVWQIGYQDVAAIGHLLADGRIATRRTYSVAGPGLRAHTCVVAPLGAALADLVAGCGAVTAGDPPRAISGSVLSGHESPFVGRYDLQVTVLDQTVLDQTVRGPAASSLLRRLLPPAGTGATIPSEAFERLFPFDLLPVPLMRALAVGDIETAERLGCIELVEEDLALLSLRCPSGLDYGALLRKTLDALWQEQVS